MYFETEMKGSSAFVHNLLFLNIFQHFKHRPFLKFSFRRFGPDNNSHWRLWNWWKDECNKLESSVWRGENLSFPCRGLAFNIFSCLLTSLKIFSQQQKVDVKVKMRKCKLRNKCFNKKFLHIYFTVVMMIFCYFWAIWSIDPPYIHFWNIIVLA